MRTESLHVCARMILGAACGLALAASAAGLDAPELPLPSPGDPVALAPRGERSAGLIAVVGGAGESPQAEVPDFSSSAEGLFEEALPDGSVRVRLQGRFQSVLVATLSADGGLQRSHRPLPGTALPLAPTREPRACQPAHDPEGREGAEGADHAKN